MLRKFFVLIFLFVLLLPYASVFSEDIKVTYNVSIYDSLNSFYSGVPALNVKATVYFTVINNSYVPSKIDFNLVKGGISGFVGISAFKKVIEAPSIMHFSMNPSIINDCEKKSLVETTENWRLRYMGRSAVSLKNGGMEEGIQVILSFKGGSKEILYDDQSGILLSEIFYIKSLSQTFVVYLQVASGPSFIGDEGVPRNNVLVLEVLSTIIFLMSIVTVGLRKRYRIL